MKWKKTGIVLVITGVALMLVSLAFPESIREDQAMIQSAQARINMEEYDSTSPPDHWESVEEAADQDIYDEKLILKAGHLLALGILFFVAGGSCLVFSMTKKTSVQPHA